MPFLPKQLTTLVGGDATLGRVVNHVRTAVQPTLDFLNTYFAVGPDNSLQVLRDIVASGALTVAGYLRAPGGATIQDLIVRGSSVVFGDKRANCLVIVPGASGTVFYTTNVGNTRAQFVVDDAGNVFMAGAVRSNANITGASLTSGNGIIGSQYEGSYSGTATAGSYNLLVDNVSGLPANWRMPRDGSIIAIYYCGMQNNAANGAAQLYKNGVFFNGASTGLVPIPQPQGTISASFAKGQFPFNAGDLIRASTYTSAATAALGGTHRAYIQVHVEWSA